MNGSNPSVLIQWKTIQIHLEHFKVKQGFIIAMEWESLSCPYGRCAHIQNYIDGLRWTIYHETIRVKRKQRDTFPLKVCYQSNIVSNPLCKIFLTSLCNLHNIQNLELKINWGFMKGSDMKIQRRHWVMKKHHLSTLTALDKPPPGHSTDELCTCPSLTHQPLWERDSDELIKQIISKMCFDDGNMISIATKNEPTDTSTPSIGSQLWMIWLRMNPNSVDTGLHLGNLTSKEPISYVYR